MQPKVQFQRELAKAIAKPFSIFEKSWQSVKSQVTGKRGYIVPVFKKGRKDNPGNYWPDSLTSVPGNMMEEILLEAMLRHMENSLVI